MFWFGRVEVGALITQILIVIGLPRSFATQEMDDAASTIDPAS